MAKPQPQEDQQRRKARDNLMPRMKMSFPYGSSYTFPSPLSTTKQQHGQRQRGRKDQPRVTGHNSSVAPGSASRAATATSRFTRKSPTGPSEADNQRPPLTTVWQVEQYQQGLDNRRRVLVMQKVSEAED